MRRGEEGREEKRGGEKREEKKRVEKTGGEKREERRGEKSRGVCSAYRDISRVDDVVGLVLVAAALDGALARVDGRGGRRAARQPGVARAQPPALLLELTRALGTGRS